MAIEHHGDHWFAYHRATHEEHNEHWKERTRLGWYCVSLSRSNSVEDPWFAAVWILPEQPLHEQTQTHVNYDKIWDHMQGLPEETVPTIITACCGYNGSPRFTVVTERGKVGSYETKPEMSVEDLLGYSAMLRPMGKTLRWASAYPVPADLTAVRYAAIWTNNPDGVAWKCTKLMDFDEFQTEFDANYKGWARPTVIIPTAESPLLPPALMPTHPWKRRVMAAWTDALVSTSITFVNVDDDKLTGLIKEYKVKNLMPVQIQAFGIGADTRYGLILGSPGDVIDRGSLVVDGSPLPPAPRPATRYLGVSRKFHRHPDSYSALASMTTTFDAAVKQDMQNTGHRAAALAVARGGHLVFAAGYTWAEQGLYPQTTPTDVFRVGSLTKIITAIAIHQLDEKQPLLNEKISEFGLRFADPDGEGIRVRHLLAHTSGIVKNAGKNFSDDKATFDRFVNNDKYPVSWKMVLEFLEGLPKFVKNKPGEIYDYSNSGYNLLGEIVRERTSGDLIHHARVRIFEPLGISLDGGSKAPRWAESERRTDQHGEVRYHDSSLKTTMTVASNSRELVPSCYGVWNLARSHGSGAWVMSAPHYLRVLSRFTLPAKSNPLFKEQATHTKFITNESPSKDTWGGLRLSSDKQTWSKPGAAPGAKAKALFTAGGWSMVYLTNSDDGSDPEDSSDDAVGIAELEGWLKPAWNSITADPQAWRNVHVST